MALSALDLPRSVPNVGPLAAGKFGFIGRLSPRLAFSPRLVVAEEPVGVMPAALRCPPVGDMGRREHVCAVISSLAKSRAAILERITDLRSASPCRRQGRHDRPPVHVGSWRGAGHGSVGCIGIRRRQPL